MATSTESRPWASFSRGNLLKEVEERLRDLFTQTSHYLQIARDFLSSQQERLIRQRTVTNPEKKRQLPAIYETIFTEPAAPGLVFDGNGNLRLLDGSFPIHEEMNLDSLIEGMRQKLEAVLAAGEYTVHKTNEDNKIDIVVKVELFLKNRHFEVIFSESHVTLVHLMRLAFAEAKKNKPNTNFIEQVNELRSSNSARRTDRLFLGANISITEYDQGKRAPTMSCHLQRSGIGTGNAEVFRHQKNGKTPATPHEEEEFLNGVLEAKAQPNPRKSSIADRGFTY
jgi:hypothetical protein